MLRPELRHLTSADRQVDLSAAAAEGPTSRSMGRTASGWTCLQGRRLSQPDQRWFPPMVVQSDHWFVRTFCNTRPPDLTYSSVVFEVGLNSTAGSPSAAPGEAPRPQARRTHDIGAPDLAVSRRTVADEAPAAGLSDSDLIPDGMGRSGGRDRAAAPGTVAARRGRSLRAWAFVRPSPRTVNLVHCGRTLSRIGHWRAPACLRYRRARPGQGRGTGECCPESGSRRASQRCCWPG